jgi:ATP-binding cassette, subfamily B, bacterial PglK
MINIIRRIFFCIEKPMRKKLINIQVLSILSSIITVTSALAIAPFLAILINKEAVLESRWIKPFSAKLPEDDLTIYLAGILVFLYCSSIVANLIVTYFNLKWSTQLEIYFKSIMFEYFIKRDLLFHINNSSKILLSKVHHDTERLKGSVIDPTLELITNLFLIFFVLSAIILVNFKVAFIVFLIFFIFYMCFYFFFKKKMKAIGDMITKSYPLYHKTISESFFSIRDTILFKKKSHFLNIFNKTAEEMCKSLTKQTFLLKLPRNVIEIFVFTIIILTMGYLIEIKNYQFEELGPLIAFYGICVLKLLPAFQKIFQSYSVIVSHASAFENIEQDLIEAKKIKDLSINDNMTKKLFFKKEIELKNVTFKYPGKRNKGLLDINLKIQKGQKVGIVGKTGSGKSTMIDLLCGFLDINQGKFIVDGEIVEKNKISGWQQNISLVPQNFFISDVSLKNNIAFGSLEENIDEDRIKECLKTACLNEFIDNLDLNLGENGERVSGGQAQRVAISRALYNNPEVLILDEATSALDTNTEKKLFENLKKKENIKTIIIVSHRIETLKECDVIYFIEQGILKKLKNYEELLQTYKKINN